MTEQDWLSASNPVPLLFYLDDVASGRKLRLLGCAICRLLRGGESSDRLRSAVAVAERYADGEATDEELAAMCEAAEAEGIMAPPCEPFAWTAAYDSIWLHASPPLTADVNAGVRATVLALLRDVFGNPFRPVAVESRWLTSSVLALARVAYVERAFDRLPVLADALQEAGCEDAGILAHCRSDGPHVRGCWAVDLLLEKA